MISSIEPLEQLVDARVLVTGALGSIGSAVVSALHAADVVVHATDLDGAPYLDVRDRDRVEAMMRSVRPSHILHLAGAKHAPGGELDPASVARTNVHGTENVLRYAAGARVVTASTCKACDPETAYGASKLIAERMTLNAGGSVARFYNVVESSGNVFRIWESLPADVPLPVTPCERYFVSLADAVALVLWAAVLEPARYAIDPGPAQRIDDVAAALYPGRPQQPMAPRRGDRLQEPRHGQSEKATATAIAGIVRITSPHE